MQRTKKFLSVVLSVIMLLSVFTSSVSAAAPVLTGSQGSGIGYGFFAEDGTTEISSVKAGDKVTVKVYATSAYDNDIIQTLGFQLWYDNTVYTYLPETFTWGPEFVTLLDTTLSKAEKITSATGVAYTNVFNAMTEEEKAYGWNEAVQGVPAIATKTWGAKENADKPIAVFQLQVLDGVEDGTVAALGAPAKSTFVKRNAFYNYVNTTNVAKPTNATSAAKLALDNGNGLTLEVKVPKCETCTEDNGTVTKPATCAEAGEMLYTCTVCGATRTETVPATGNHTAGDPVDENVVAPSCDTAGSKEVVVKCSVCEFEMSRTTETIPATGDHNYATKKVIAEATCTEAGSYVMVCGCGEEDTPVTVDALGHDFSEVDAEAVAPTCTAPGSEVLMGCSRCDATEGGAEVEALGHNMVAGDVVAPTCTTDGYTVYTCANNCGTTENRDVTPATDHDYEAVVTEPTCTEGGYTTYTCPACGDTYTADEVPATGHDYEATVTREPTCTRTGTMKYTCSCGDTYREDIPALNHTNPDGTSALETIPAVAPTCTVQGYTEGKLCTICNAQAVVPQGVPATGHTKDPNNAVVTAPTYTSQGYTTYTCPVCGDTFVDDYVPALTVEFTFEIAAPSVTTLRAGDTIILHPVFTGEVAEGVTVEWTADNENFKVVEVYEDGSVKVQAKKVVKGTDGVTTFTATAVDSDGKEISSDTVELTANAKFFQQFLGFFRTIFGLAKHYEA